MKSLSVFAIPSAIALLLAAAASSAQDKPNTAPAKKPNASISSSAKAAKAAARAPAQSNGVDTKGISERAGAKPGTPEVNNVVPTAERDYDGCHGKDSDA